MHRSPLREATLLPRRSSDTQESRSPGAAEVGNAVAGGKRDADGWSVSRQADGGRAVCSFGDDPGAHCLFNSDVENPVEPLGCKKRDDVDFFVPYALNKFRGRQHPHKREQEGTKDDEAAGEGRGIGSSCALWDETESDDTQLGEVSRQKDAFRCGVSSKSAFSMSASRREL